MPSNPQSQALWAAKKDAVVNVFNSLLSGIKNAMSGIAGAVKSGFDAAINFIQGLPSQALQWGKDIIGGLISGIKSEDQRPCGQREGHRGNHCVLPAFLRAGRGAAFQLPHLSCRI